jgi:transposase
VFLEVISGQLSQADCARKWGIDVGVVIRIRKLAKDAALAAFGSAKPGRGPLPEQAELEAALAENARLLEALNELAVERSLHRGRQRSGVSARSPLG